MMNLDFISPMYHQDYLASESFDEEDQNILNFYDQALGKMSRPQLFEVTLPLIQTKFEVFYSSLLEIGSEILTLA
jgi:hypothetical protein